jgi:hypothetical protein
MTNDMDKPVQTTPRLAYDGTYLAGLYINMSLVAIVKILPRQLDMPALHGISACTSDTIGRYSSRLSNDRVLSKLTISSS